ncbi:MAG: DUF937 domain-containing protein [Cyanobacteria bacterium P01_F01_bin.86]
MFFEVLSAINDPKKQASIDQLSQVTQSVQQLATSQGLNDTQMQSVMTALGGALQPVLKQKQPQLGGSQMATMLAQVAGSGKAGVLQSLVTPQLQQQLAATVAQKTGINAGIVQAMVPHLLPVVMGLFNMGSPKPGAVGGGNPLLTAFLDSDRDGSTDLGDVMKFAGRFLNTPN